ncbi:mitoguardin 2 isoform X4 [Kogia breviceps]|uniref:mitoguardin 2 isoform X4 n=1 Tax=Kogia breviceps TaxID=27615 RepID=UPI0034D1F58B
MCVPVLSGRGWCLGPSQQPVEDDLLGSSRPRGLSPGVPILPWRSGGLRSAFSQLRLTPGLRKVLFATALGTVALALAAHQLKRRRRKKKQVGPEMGGEHLGTVPLPILMARKVPSVKKGYSSRRVQSPGSKSNDTLSSISSIEPSKHSGSSHSLASPESQRREFAEKLESLLHRAYHLQEEFGSTLPADNVLLELERTLMLPLTEGSLHLRADHEDSLTSEDSFFSATELFEPLQVGDYPSPLSRPAAAYEEALQLVKEGRVPCRTLRTELLGCYSDQDFLAKLHCVRQAFEGLLEDKSHQFFFGEVGRQMVTGLMTKAEKSPKGFLESYEEMLSYALRPETWATTRLELEGRGVVCMSFFDIVLDFILMDAFEDLENPPSSVLAVLRNRWLSDSFKETALATACWSVLKAKRRLLMVPDGFISHFYSVSEHVSPVLAFGFLGPKPQLSEVCAFFKHQIVQYLRDMFDLDNVRYTSVPALADDILQLSRRRSEILLGYLGAPVANSIGLNGVLPRENGPPEVLQ